MIVLDDLEELAMVVAGLPSNKEADTGQQGAVDFCKGDALAVEVKY